MDNRPIGIFDSGLGGLTCVKEVMKIMPNEDIIYFGDTGRVPYGTRSRETVIKYVKQDINFLETFDIKYIIIACGTASSAALPFIEEEYDAKISGVLYPAAQSAVKATKNKKIGVIGTTGTVKSGKYIEAIHSLMPDAEVFQKACPLFVPLVENGMTEDEATSLIATEYLKEIRNAGVDTIILGCTHYPLLTDVIREIVGEGVALIDSGAQAAKFAKEDMEKLGLLSEKQEKGKARFFVSDSIENFSELGSMFLQKEIDGDVSFTDIEKY